MGKSHSANLLQKLIGCCNCFNPTFVHSWQTISISWAAKSSTDTWKWKWKWKWQSFLVYLVSRHSPTSKRNQHKLKFQIVRTTQCCPKQLWQILKTEQIALPIIVVNRKDWNNIVQLHFGFFHAYAWSEVWTATTIWTSRYSIEIKVSWHGYKQKNWI